MEAAKTGDRLARAAIVAAGLLRASGEKAAAAELLEAAGDASALVADLLADGD
jgi:hypothetical protein